MAPPEKRCLYEVLGLSKDCSPEEIRSAYRRLALQRHPDKLVKAGGLSEAEATAQFQELVHAYEVLSDPKERAWYDSHRSQILFADHASGGSKSGGMPGSVPNLFAFFSNTVYSGHSDTGKGFYKVYSDLFNSIYQNEINFANRLGLSMDSVREAPLMGNLESPYAQVTAFYNYWLGFSTVMDFCWVDQYDVMAGPNRKSRRVMEEENKKLRKKAKREYNETVRGLAEFVKKRDKRVIDMMVKKNAEMEKRKEEERERKKKMEKEKMERARNYEEPEWAKIEEGEEEEMGFSGFENEGSDKRKSEELYCVVCSKKFKSEKQWKNHEQSKKHKEKVAELRESFSELDEKEEEEIDGFDASCENAGGLDGKLKEQLKIEDDEEEEEKESQEEAIGQGSEDGGRGFDTEEDMYQTGGSEFGDDDEMSLLKSMVFGHKNKKKNISSREETELSETKFETENESDNVEYDNQNSVWRNRRDRKDKGKKNSGKASTGEGNIDDSQYTEGSKTGAFDGNVMDETGLMEYDNRKSTGRNRKGKKGRSKKISGGILANDVNMTKSLDEDGTQNENGHSEESHEAFDQNESMHKVDGHGEKASHQIHGTNTNSKKLSRGRKTKATGKSAVTMCEGCGEKFESRNKLHKHLGETGHATLKSR